MKRRKKKVAKKASKKTTGEPSATKRKLKKRSVRDRVHLAIMADAKTLLFAISTMKGVPQGQVVEESINGYLNRQPRGTRDSIVRLYESLLAEQEKKNKK